MILVPWSLSPTIPFTPRAAIDSLKATRMVLRCDPKKGVVKGRNKPRSFFWLFEMEDFEQPPKRKKKPSNLNLWSLSNSASKFKKSWHEKFQRGEVLLNLWSRIVLTSWPEWRNACIYSEFLGIISSDLGQSAMVGCIGRVQFLLFPDFPG